MIKEINYGFYTIDAEYLSKIDTEVYYDESYKTSTKPFLVIIEIENYKYFIPLSSAKKKNIKWKNVSKEHYLIKNKIKC